MPRQRKLPSLAEQAADTYTLLPVSVDQDDRTTHIHQFLNRWLWRANMVTVKRELIELIDHLSHASETP